MNLLADEGVDKPIVDLLRASGFNVHYILETHQGAEDEVVLQIANQEARILITQDKDIGELIYRLQKVHLGIILIRLGDYDSVQKAGLVLLTIDKFKEKLGNAFTVIQPNAVRIRKSV